MQRRRLSRVCGNGARHFYLWNVLKNPREEFRDNWQVSGVEIVHVMPDDLVIDMRLDACSVHIGSKTPPEIAISIIAEMTAIRNGVVVPEAMEK